LLTLYCVRENSSSQKYNVVKPGKKSNKLIRKPFTGLPPPPAPRRCPAVIEKIILSSSTPLSSGKERSLKEKNSKYGHLQSFLPGGGGFRK
jgi:hypothetical protein